MRDDLGAGIEQMRNIPCFFTTRPRVPLHKTSILRANAPYNRWLIFLFLANLAVIVTLFTEVYLLINDKLTVNRNLGIQIGKTIYVGGIWIWRLIAIVVSCSKFHCGGGIWSALFELLVQTVLLEYV